VGPNRVGQGPLQNRQGRLGTQFPAQTALPIHQLQPLHRQRAGTKECQAADAGEDPSRRAISFRGRQHRLRAERQFFFPGEDNRCPTPAHRGLDLGPPTGEHSGSPKTPVFQRPTHRPPQLPVAPAHRLLTSAAGASFPSLPSGLHAQKISHRERHVSTTVRATSTAIGKATRLRP
jgi:hypothetical protein